MSHDGEVLSMVFGAIFVVNLIGWIAYMVFGDDDE